MAREIHPRELPPFHPSEEGFELQYTAHMREFNRLIDTSNRLPDGKYVGGVLEFETDDGPAYYIVISGKPILVQRILLLDSKAAVDKKTIEGLTRKKIIDHLRKQREEKGVSDGRDD